MALFEEASPICRGKNLSWETILLFYNNMPREAMPKAKFNSYTEARINGWTQTHSQIARQLAFYYEEEGVCYPRFTKEMSYADLFKYMQNWAAKYFVPNPYAPSLKGNIPTCIYEFILNAIESGKTNFDEILDSMFGIKLSSHDKVRVYLNNFTDLIIDDNRVSLNKRTFGMDSIIHPDEIYAIDSKKYFDYFDISSDINSKTYRTLNEALSIQQIFYGAPGTGKSHSIKEKTEKAEKEERVFRTTFHPDSDYSTFIGCYKPTMKEVPKTTLIGTKVVEVENGMPEEKIVYRFVPQAFTNAYVKAWNITEDVYLIIEEINRGNCAQIFGDLFQLLDRGDDGKSEYPIDADTDLGNYLAKELGNSTRTDFPDGVKGGKKLVLPKNLYIWATMNTSDQSLFPIDSAFKRRWDWKYLPIENAEKGWKIKVNGHEYDWYKFLEAINKEVLTLTHSEDKQLGYFFAKAKDGIIDAVTLVNKVYFYLWTDVFKDYDYESQKAFRKPNSNDPIVFKNFFEELKNDEKVNEEVAEQVLVNLELEKINKPQDLFE